VAAARRSHCAGRSDDAPVPRERSLIARKRARHLPRPSFLRLRFRSEAHSAAHSAAGRHRRRGLFRQFGDHCLGGDEESGHRAGILQSRANHLGRIDNALIDHVDMDGPLLLEEDVATGINYDYGKIINESRFNTLAGYLQKDKIFYGGKINKKELHMEPTILINVSMNDDVMKEEIFGPILPVLPFNTTEEAMQIVHQNENPLAFYLFTKDKKIEEKWIKKIPFGGGCINNTVWHFANKNIPFGGIGKSGTGAYHGKNTFDTFTHAKPVLKTSTLIDPSLKYPSFQGKMKWFKRLIG